MREGLQTRVAGDVRPEEHGLVATQKHEVGVVSHEGVIGL
jgi:hypothetical protein